MLCVIHKTRYPSVTGEASGRTKIDEDLQAVSLTADEAPVSEALAALSAKFGFVNIPTPGLDRTIGGFHSGTVQQVLERVLAGRDYVEFFRRQN